MNLKDVKFYPATNQGGDGFVGIKIVNNEIEFHYPITFELSKTEDGLRRDIISVIKTIRLAKSFTKEKSSHYRKYKKEYVFPLNSFLWIINDYLIYGRYVNLEKKFCNFHL